MVSRNEAEGIVQRTHKNLVYMRNARKKGDDVHEVTHLVNSLLGLIVVPWEDGLGQGALDTRIDELIDQGWPRVDILKDEYKKKTETLGRLVNHMRNAVAHGRLRFEGIEPFSADSRDPSKIRVILTDGPKRGVDKWRAEIRGEDLYQLCEKFIDYIYDKVS